MHKHGYQLIEALEQCEVELTEITPVQYGHKFVAVQGVQRVSVIVYETKGTIQVQGPDVELKGVVERIARAIEMGRPVKHVATSSELNTVVQALEEAGVDVVVREYMTEAVSCVQNNILLGGMFVLGGAWERMMRLVMEAYVRACPEEERAAVTKRLLDKKPAEAQRNLYQELKQVKGQIANLPSEWENSLTMADYHRQTRNAVGHPDRVTPHLDPDGCRLVVYMSKQYLITLQILIRALESLEAPLTRNGSK